MKKCKQSQFQMKPRLSVLLLFLLAASASADAELDDSDESDVVYADSPVPLSGVSVSISPKDLQDSLASNDGAGFLVGLPGFSQVRNGGSNGDPVFRGMFGSRLNILSSGGTILGGCGSRMDSPASYISPTNYDVITVVKGPQTTLWGPVASAGTVLFERSPKVVSDKNLSGELGWLYGSNDRADKNASVLLGSTSGYLNLVGNTTSSGDYKDAHGKVIPGRWNKWNADAVTGWTPDPGTLFELSFGAGDGEAVYAGRGMDGTQFLRRSASFYTQKQNVTDSISKIDLQVFRNYTYHIMDNYTLREPVNGMKMASHVDRLTYGGRASSEWSIPLGGVISGVDWQSNSHRQLKKTQWVTDAKYEQYGGFIEVSGEQSMVSGVRLDLHKMADQRPGGDKREEWLKGGFIRYEPRILNNGSAYIGLGYTERFPDYWELFSSKANQNDINTLRVEKTSQIDIGAAYSLPTAGFWASSYLGYVDDYIIFDYHPVKNRAKNVDALIFGGELGAKWHFSPQWTLDIETAFAWGENVTESRPLPQIPPLDTRLSLSYAHNQWESTLEWRLLAKQKRVAVQQGNVVGKDFGYAAGAGVINWRAYYSIAPDLKANFGIDNLLNKQYSEHLNLSGNKSFGFPGTTRLAEQGRGIWMGVDVSF